jgi:hypothetical protein
VFRILLIIVSYLAGISPNFASFFTYSLKNTLNDVDLYIAFSFSESDITSFSSYSVRFSLLCLLF